MAKKKVFLNCGVREDDEEDSSKTKKKAEKVECLICNGCPNFIFSRGCCKAKKVPAINAMTGKPEEIPIKVNGVLTMVPKQEYMRIPTSVMLQSRGDDGFFKAYLKPADCTFDWEEKKKESVQDPASNPAGASNNA
jgi:hypothetical protein